MSLKKLYSIAITFCLARDAGALRNAPFSGRFLLALPMLIYPALHFVYLPFVAAIIPPWIPWHAFWTIFTAITIFMAGLAILLGWHTQLAAFLLGVELLIFCLTIHVFILLRLPGDTWAAGAMFGDLPSRLMNAPKDFGMCGACFILAGTVRHESHKYRPNFSLAFGLVIFCLSILAFAVLHFFYPNFAPGIEPMFASITFPLPGGHVLAYLTGAEFLIIVAAIAAKWHAHLAAMTLGFTILLFDLLVYGPHFIHEPSMLFGNWLKDIGVAGGAFLLAGYMKQSRQSHDRFIATASQYQTN
jgi:hypothetical protein